MGSMKILQVTQYFRPNDAATVIIATIVDELRHRGYDVKVATPDPYCKDDVSVRLSHRLLAKDSLINSSFSRFFVCTFSYIMLFPKILKEAKYADIIVSHHHNFHFATILSYLLAKLYNKPYAVFIHDVLTYNSTSAFFSRLFDNIFYGLNVAYLKNASVLFVQSQAIKASFGFKDAVVLPNSVRSELYLANSANTVEALRTRLGLEGKRVLLFLGTAYKDRGLALLVKAISKIAVDYPEMVVLFVGRAPDRQPLLDLAKELGVEDKLLFTGVVPHGDVPVYIQMCDVAIGPLAPPPTLCTLPVKVLEYMAGAKPTIALEGSVPPELLIDGHTGLFLSKIDAAELACLIVQLLDNPIEAKRIGETARRCVLLNYDAEVVVDRLLESLTAQAALGKYVQRR